MTRKSPTNQTRGDGDGGDNNKNPLWNWVKSTLMPLHFFTALLVVVAGLQTCILHNTDKTLVDTLNTNKLSQRAFIFPALSQTYLSPDANAPDAINFTFTLANNGNTATRRLTFFLKCTPSAEDLDEPWILITQGRGKTEQGTAVIGPKGAATAGCSFPWNQLQEMFTKKMFGYILIDVSYEDGMNAGIIRKTQFAVRLSQIALTPARIEGPLQISAGATVLMENRGKHNCADEDCPK
jgi:hypothetical protein